jgi:deoxyribonuclease V
VRGEGQVRVTIPHPWPQTPDEAIALQERLRRLVEPAGHDPRRIERVAGLDVAYAGGSNRLAAAVVVLDVETLEVLDSAVAVGLARFPYLPGLFAFRELPALVAALERLATTPDLLVADGNGLAHPRRFGLACHLGVLTGLPAIGVAKTCSVATYDLPEPRRGRWTPLRAGNEVIGRALRTQDGVKPVFVSVGHRIDLDAACRYVLRLTPRFRLPETTRQADHLARLELRAQDRQGPLTK